ncbi:hypothetical protein CXB51_003406 [Gossypium anomalum]|uniref:Transmembrane protein 230 n=1 Tax=Gossypium anomalum TaxID=47600 RepID=A0A8J6DAI5_9ROSI|nr:hypothetical protein CXB51_003406 [Gossypium anomalum]
MYVEHAFSISDEDIMMDTPHAINNRPPYKEIGLAVALLVFGTLGIILGIFMAVNKVGGDRAHGSGFSLQYSDPFCSFQASIIQGLHIMHLRDTKASPSPTFPLSRALLLQLLCPMYRSSFIYLLSFECFVPADSSSFLDFTFVCYLFHSAILTSIPVCCGCFMT